MTGEDYSGYFNVGDEVNHPVYGDGEVIACTRPISKLYYRIDFGGHSMSCHHSKLTRKEEE
jgi:hypothetical protein